MAQDTTAGAVFCFPSELEEEIVFVPGSTLAKYSAHFEKFRKGNCGEQSLRIIQINTEMKYKMENLKPDLITGVK